MDILIFLMGSAVALTSVYYMIVCIDFFNANFK